MAVNITPLPPGTVIFEDTSVEQKKGKVLKTLKMNKRASDPLGGRIQFETAKGLVILSFICLIQESMVVNSDSWSINAGLK